MVTSGLINEVAKEGKQIVITKHGHAVALLIPAERPKENDMAEVIKGMRALSAEIGKKGMTLEEMKKLRDEGRK
jgi:antitoxin (DNA-binding transcriptional repressor) of toxin-antitoxin stability system